MCDSTENLIADGLNNIATALHKLGNNDASEPFGGLEALGMTILDGSEKIANAIQSLASAIEEK